MGRRERLLRGRSACPVSVARPPNRLTRRSPPGKWTSTSPSPCVAAATATALVPGRARLPHAPLPHTRGDLARPVDASHLDVRAIREARMGLEQWPDARQLVRVADHDRVGIADVDDDHIQPRDLLGLSDGDRAEILLHVTVLDSCDGRARPDVDAHFPRRWFDRRASEPRYGCRCPDSSAVEPSGFQITTSALVGLSWRRPG